MKSCPERVQPIYTHFREQRTAIEQFGDAFHKFTFAVVTARLVAVQELRAMVIIAIYVASEIDAKKAILINNLHVAHEFEQFSEIGDIHIAVVAFPQPCPCSSKIVR